MFRKDTKPKKREVINLTLADGGLGDLLCYLVVVDYILKEITWVDPIIWVPDFLEEFTRNVLPKHACIYNYSKAAKAYNSKLTGLTTAWKSQHTAMRIHPVDYAAHQLIDADLPIEKKNYLKFNSKSYDLTQYNLPENYVTISVGSTARVKELPVNVLNQIIDYVIAKGYTPVFLGKTEASSGKGLGGLKAKLAEVDYSKGIDLTNKTRLCETTAVIAGSKAHIGMEGGLTHLAGFTETPIVAGYSFVNPEIMQPIRGNRVGGGCYPVTPENNLACRYCQTNWSLMYSHNFQECYYKDYQCIQQLTFSKFKEKIDEAFRND